jgi:predicted RNase H-like HicB family nuclease
MPNRGGKDVRTYPAIFSRNGSTVSVEFPDLPGCVTFGKTEEEAISRAKEALEGFLYYSEQDGDVVSAPTPFDKLAVKKREAVVLVTVRMDIVREEEANKSITKSVTIPNWLNKLGIEANINFSGALQDALKERLGV